GYSLQGALQGIESQLVAFIRDDSRQVDKTTWFNFDHLNFKTGSAELDLEYSQQQLTNIYEVLKAFPKVRIKIGGYTDNVGKEAANQKLSQARAETVQNALIKMGNAKNRLTAEGYGSQHPVASNDTEEGRAQNRRTAIRVTEK
ncbi:MAG: OmpA family protein, partial [Saprospiraceae bacterium]